MGTTGSVDGAGRLVIRGRFQQKQIENVLRRYIGKTNLPRAPTTLNSHFLVQWNTSLAKLANPLTLFLQRRIVSSSCLASRVAVGVQLIRSRVVSRPRSARGARTGLDRMCLSLFYQRLWMIAQHTSTNFQYCCSSLDVPSYTTARRSMVTRMSNPRFFDQSRSPTFPILPPLCAAQQVCKLKQDPVWPAKYLQVHC